MRPNTPPTGRATPFMAGRGRTDGHAGGQTMPDRIATAGRAVRAGQGPVALCLLLAGCAGYATPDAPTLALPGRFLAAPAAAPMVAPVPRLLQDAAWWRNYGDPVLDRLVATALAANPDLAVAQARIAEADAERRRVGDGWLLTPLLGARTTTTDPGRPEARTDTRGEARLTLEALFDPWGGRAASRAAATARLAAAGAEAAGARLLLLDRVVAAYLDLRLTQRLAGLRRTEAAGRRQTLQMARDLAAAGQATQVDILRSEARLAEIAAELPGLDAAIAGRLAELAVLAGAAPGTLEAGLTRALASPAALPHPRMPADIGIPADLLRNRPDLQAAEARYYAALAEIDVARAALYPRLSLSGALTAAVRSPGPGGVEAFIGPALLLPALPDGPGRAGVAAREAQARGAHAAWHAAVLRALGEVEGALANQSAAAAALGAAAQAARLRREVRDLTRIQIDSGAATLQDLIEAETGVALAEAEAARAAFRRAAAHATLNIRLGAGHATTP